MHRTVLFTADWLPRGAELSGEQGDGHQDTGFSISSRPSPPTGGRRRDPARTQSLEPPSKPGGPVRSCFLPHLQVALSWGASRCQGLGWWCGVWGTPLVSTVPSGGPAVPLEATGKLFSRRKRSKAVWLLTRGRREWGEAGRARRPPCKPRSYKMHFPTHPSGLSEPLLLTALFIHDRQLINIQTS